MDAPHVIKKNHKFYECFEILLVENNLNKIDL